MDSKKTTKFYATFKYNLSYVHNFEEFINLEGEEKNWTDVFKCGGNILGQSASNY